MESLLHKTDDEILGTWALQIDSQLLYGLHFTKKDIKVQWSMTILSFSALHL